MNEYTIYQTQTTSDKEEQTTECYVTNMSSTCTLYFFMINHSAQEKLKI